MAFTRMPFGDSSTAIALVIPSMAVLLALYAITFGNPYCAAMELMLMMLPEPLGNICFTTSRLMVNTAVTFVVIIF